MLKLRQAQPVGLWGIKRVLRYIGVASTYINIFWEFSRPEEISTMPQRKHGWYWNLSAEKKNATYLAPVAARLLFFYFDDLFSLYNNQVSHNL